MIKQVEVVILPSLRNHSCFLKCFFLKIFTCKVFSSQTFCFENVLFQKKVFFHSNFRNNCLGYLQSSLFRKFLKSAKAKHPWRCSLLVMLQTGNMQLLNSTTESPVRVIFAKFCDILQNSNYSCFSSDCF